MSSTIATAARIIPLVYRCTYCGAKNADVSQFTSRAIARGVSKKSSASARQFASEALDSNITRSISKVNNKHKLELLNCDGLCKSCGARQPWALKKLRKSIRWGSLPICLLLVMILIYLSTDSVGKYDILVSLMYGSLLWAILHRILCKAISFIIARITVYKMVKQGMEDCYPILITPPMNTKPDSD